MITTTIDADLENGGAAPSSTMRHVGAWLKRRTLFCYGHGAMIGRHDMFFAGYQEPERRDQEASGLGRLPVLPSDPSLIRLESGLDEHVADSGFDGAFDSRRQSSMLPRP